MRVTTIVGLFADDLGVDAPTCEQTCGSFRLPAVRLSRHLPVGAHLRMLALLLLAACSPGSASYTCEKTWTFDTGVETGEYLTNTLDCATYKEEGDQIRNGDENACVEEGLEAGAIESTCTCSNWTKVRCPGGAND